MKSRRDPPMILSSSFSGMGICQQINSKIPDASVIVSVVHERDEIGTLIVTVYYRG